MRRRLGALTAAIPTVEHFERPEYLEEVDLVQRDGAWACPEFYAQLILQASIVGRLVLTVGLLAALPPWLGLLPLFGLPSLLAAPGPSRSGSR